MDKKQKLKVGPYGVDLTPDQQMAAQYVFEQYNQAHEFDNEFEWEDGPVDFEGIFVCDFCDLNGVLAELLIALGLADSEGH